MLSLGYVGTRIPILRVPFFFAQPIALFLQHTSYVVTVAAFTVASGPLSSPVAFSTEEDGERLWIECSARAIWL